MKKVIGFIISLMVMFSAVGCMDDDTGSLPINPDSSNSTTDMEADSKEEEFNSTETESDESSGNDSGSSDDSSSNENENKPSKESDGWTGFY